MAALSPRSIAKEMEKRLLGGGAMSPEPPKSFPWVVTRRPPGCRKTENAKAV